MGPGGLATPNRAGVCGRPPTTRPLLTVREDGGCIVLVLGVGRCAFRPPRVVFVLGLVSLINSLTSGKNAITIHVPFFISCQYQDDEVGR